MNRSSILLNINNIIIGGSISFGDDVFDVRFESAIFITVIVAWKLSWTSIIKWLSLLNFSNWIKFKNCINMIFPKFFWEFQFLWSNTGNAIKYIVFYRWYYFMKLKFFFIFSWICLYITMRRYLTILLMMEYY